MLADILAQLQQKQPLEGDSGVAAAFELNWECLEPETQQLACLLSLFALTPIPWSLIESTASASNLEFDIKANCNVLIQRYILQKPAEDTYQIHERIRELLHLMLEQLPQGDELKHGFCQAMVVVAQGIPQSATQIEIARVSLAIPHIAEAATVYQDWLNSEDLIWPFVGLGRFYESQGAYAQALAWKEQYLSFARERLGEERLAVAQSYNNLANLYSSQGRYSEAGPLYQKALELRQRLLGEEHPDITASYNNLAWETVNQGTEGQDLSGANLSGARKRHSSQPKTMWNFLSKNIRLSVTLILLAASILLLTIIFSFVKKENLLYIIGLSVSYTEILTTLIQIILLATERVERFTIQRRFLKVFGCDKNSIADGAIAIVIPAFNIGRLTSSQPNSSMKQHAETILSKSSTKAGIKNDVAAASHIILAFSQLGLPIPQIRWDEEITFRDDQIKTYILIGLSNKILNLIQQPTDKYFILTPTTDKNNNLAKISIKLGSFDGVDLLPENQWTTEDSISFNSQTNSPENGIDYALFAKFRMNNKIFVICGAGTESGTHDIGMYISDSGWRQVYAELKKEKGTSITANEAFAVTFQVPTGRQVSENISIAHKCIKKTHKSSI